MSHEATSNNTVAKVVGFALCTLLLVLSVSAEPQQPTKTHRIALLSLGSIQKEGIEAFREVLRSLGYVEGQNLIIEYRFAEGKPERLADFVSELIRLKVEIIVSNSTEAIEMVRRANPSMPVVMASVSDPIGSGLVASLAKPGGNITGTTQVSTDLAGKRLELLKEVVPSITRVALLVQRNHPPTQSLIPEMQKAAEELKITVQAFEISTPDEFEGAFTAIKNTRAGAVFIQNNTIFNANVNVRRFAELALKHRLPTTGGHPSFVIAGGLMFYGPDPLSMIRRSAYFVDKIIKGTKPADLPVEQPMKFELIINLKTAKILGLTIPQTVLYRADKVIK